MSRSTPLPYGLHAGFLLSAQRHPERPALDVAGQQFSYAQLHQLALAMAHTLAQHCPAQSPPRVGILASRSLPVYAGLLGALMAGCGVVPLNPGFPLERTRQMMALAGLAALVVDAGGESQLDALLQGQQTPLLVCLPGASVDAARAERWPQHHFVAMAAAQAPAAFEPVSVTPDALAYLFFTSGSTGAPKGVGVLHRNVLRFVQMSVDRYRDCGITEHDRFSQFYDITFDSSMFDLYVGWAFGACVCCPSHVDWVNPNKYIESKALTVIDIVPSTGHAMNRSNGWRRGRFSALRLCRFGGEALSADLAAALAAAAPAAQLDNVYGPTECTVDAAYYRWDAALSPTECGHGVVPIGVAGPQVGLMVVDSALQEVRSAPRYSTQEFAKLIQMMRFDRPGNDYAKEASLASAESLKASVSPVALFPSRVSASYAANVINGRNRFPPFASQSYATSSVRPSGLRAFSGVLLRTRGNSRSKSSVNNLFPARISGT